MSDKDFFFDEDETLEGTSAEAPAATGNERTRTSRAGRAAPAAAAPTFGTQSVSMTVAALFSVVALLAGIIIGILIPAGPGRGVPAPTITGGQSTPAPQLTPEQLQSGELPPGHPPIDGSGTTTPTRGATPSSEATKPTRSTQETE